jgi:hypothetical protein
MPSGLNVCADVSPGRLFEEASHDEMRLPARKTSGIAVDNKRAQTSSRDDGYGHRRQAHRWELLSALQEKFTYSPAQRLLVVKLPHSGPALLLPSFPSCPGPSIPFPVQKPHLWQRIVAALGKSEAREVSVRLFKLWANILQWLLADSMHCRPSDISRHAPRRCPTGNI